ncbi:unnamed protein product [Arabidopsis arenosa]|uniref:Uncharacterized protein n=1 Tax=Arabidopsis arenosa TaxID=38785 RepID=A0A8S2ABU8_ARAAE|nr:unnamed protein product [Arabidopsis arenosa]
MLWNVADGDMGLKDNLQNLVTGKHKHSGDSSSFVSLQEQLKEAQQKIEEQAAYNAHRDAEVAARDAVHEAEHSRAVADQKDKLEHLSLAEKYMCQTDPAFLDFMATHSPESTTNRLSTLVHS